MKFCIKNQDDLNVMSLKWFYCKKLMYAEGTTQIYPFKNKTKDEFVE